MFENVLFGFKSYLSALENDAVAGILNTYGYQQRRTAGTDAALISSAIH